MKKVDTNNAVHGATDAHPAVGRVRRRPKNQTMPARTSAGATNSKSATHIPIDDQEVYGRVRRAGPVVTRSPTDPRPAATNSTNDATQSVSETQEVSGRVEPRPTQTSKSIHRPAGAPNSHRPTRVSKPIPGPADARSAER